MQQSTKIRVAVLYGGRSAEHEVSLRSAANVIQYLDPSRFEVVPIGIDKQGNWLLGDTVFSHSLEHQCVMALRHDAHPWFTPEWLGKSASINQHELMVRAQTSFDVIFPAVHGTFCEDGSLQGLLELAGLPYVGSGVLASAVGMDKDVSKRLSLLAGIPVAPYLVIKLDQWQAEPALWVKQIEETVSYPVFVKPANTGSSIGITKVKEASQIISAIEEAFRFDNKILIEKALSIIELEVAVLESLTSSQDPIVSKVGEVRPNHEFYSYEAKYLDEDGADLRIPALIADKIQVEAQRMAKQLFIILECEGMARVDLFLDRETEQLYFNEVNTLPGFTQISMYPKLMAASGISYTELLTRLIDLAIHRHKHKSRLMRNYTD